MTVNDGIDDWFAARGWTVFPFQREAWRAYADGESGLIHSPTGSGKSLAAWVGPLRRIAAGEPCRGLRVLWLTPLRALASDTAAGLNEIAAAIGVTDAVKVRTGDTPASERKRQLAAPPPALVTTPESLSLLLSYADSARQFRHLDAVIVDEWHELLGTKRGVQLELCLARLRRMAPGLRVWGLSATLGNLGQALAVLLGPSGGGRLIAGAQPKTTRIRSALPPAIERFPWAGHLGVALLDQVVAALGDAATTLLFTNTRSQAELWFEALTRARPDWLGVVA
ncbi:MAG: DEAD/DEAH box helicase, partial [Pseudomonadota bacterium]